jgi:hypothetical protein
MDTLLLIFLIAGGIGFIFLMISLIIGDLFEALDFDFDMDFDGDGGGEIGILDSRVISVFLTAFGGIAALTLYIGFGGIFSSIVGLISGLVFGGLIFAFAYLLHSQQSTSSVSEGDLIGRTAKVIVGIQPGSIGQISCRIGEERVEKLARTRDGEAIKEGVTVFIEEAAGDSFIVSSMEGTTLALIDE